VDADVGPNPVPGLAIFNRALLENFSQAP
jgi:hypothetical protein